MNAAAALRLARGSNEPSREISARFLPLVDSTQNVAPLAPPKEQSIWLERQFPVRCIAIVLAGEPPR